MNSLLDEAIAKTLLPKERVSQKMQSYILHSNNIKLREIYYDNSFLSPDDLRRIISLESDINLLLILFKKYYCKSTYAKEFIKSRRKEIIFLSIAYVKLSPSDFKSLVKQLGKPYIKKNSHLLERYNLGGVLTPQASELFLRHLPPQSLIYLNFTPTNNLCNIYNNRFKSLNSENNFTYLFFIFLDLKYSFTGKKELSLQEINTIIESPLGKTGQNLLQDALPYLDYETIVNVIPFINNLNFGPLFLSNSLTGEEKDYILGMYPRAIISLIDQEIHYALNIELHQKLIAYLLQSYQDNQTYFYLSKLISLNYCINIDELLHFIIELNPNRRLYKLILSEKYTSLEVALKLPANITLTSYWDQVSLVNYIFEELSTGEHATFTLLLKEFDGSIGDLLNIVHNLRSEQAH